MHIGVVNAAVFVFQHPRLKMSGRIWSLLTLTSLKGKWYSSALERCVFFRLEFQHNSFQNVQVTLQKADEKDWWALYLRQEVNKCVRENWENAHKVSYLTPSQRIL